MSGILGWRDGLVGKERLAVQVWGTECPPCNPSTGEAGRPIARALQPATSTWRAQGQGETSSQKTKQKNSMNGRWETTSKVDPCFYMHMFICVPAHAHTCTQMTFHFEKAQFNMDYLLKLESTSWEEDSKNSKSVIMKQNVFKHNMKIEWVYHIINYMYVYIFLCDCPVNIYVSNK